MPSQPRWFFESLATFVARFLAKPFATASGKMTLPRFRRHCTNKLPATLLALLVRLEVRYKRTQVLQKKNKMAFFKYHDEKKPLWHDFALAYYSARIVRYSVTRSNPILRILFQFNILKGKSLFNGHL